MENLTKVLKKIRNKFKIFQVENEIRNRRGELHFRRYSYFSSKYFSIYKHLITQPDKEKHEHDHPWNFISFILKGSYTEMVDGKLHPRKRYSFKYMKATHHHRLYSIDGESCETIVIVGRRFREWGYPTENGWIDKETYREMKRNGEL